MQSHLSYGGMCGTGLQSYTATVLNAAESVKKGLSIVGMCNSLLRHSITFVYLKVNLLLNYSSNFI